MDREVYNQLARRHRRRADGPPHEKGDKEDKEKATDEKRATLSVLRTARGTELPVRRGR